MGTLEVKNGIVGLSTSSRLGSMECLAVAPAVPFLYSLIVLQYTLNGTAGTSKIREVI